jgi:hypothetical protein
MPLLLYFLLSLLAAHGAAPHLRLPQRLLRFLLALFPPHPAPLPDTAPDPAALRARLLQRAAVEQAAAAASDGEVSLSALDLSQAAPPTPKAFGTQAQPLQPGRSRQLAFPDPPVAAAEPEPALEADQPLPVLPPPFQLPPLGLPSTPPAHVQACSAAALSGDREALSSAAEALEKEHSARVAAIDAALAGVRAAMESRRRGTSGLA